MPQKTQNQIGTDAQQLLCALTTCLQAPNHHRHRDAPRGVRLRVKEKLGTNHAIGLGSFKIGPGHVRKILFHAQYAGAGVIDV